MQCRVIPYEGNEPYVFFSYSHKDAPRVYPILEQLTQDGFRVWYDDGNHAGDDWLENIGQHLNRSAVCLAMLSENAEKSHNCKKEVSFAVQCNKKVLAVMLEKFPMTMGMRLQLSTIHYLDRTEYPSDTALLQKLYESECLCVCRAEPGSLPMRSDYQEVLPEEPVSHGNFGVSAFVADEIFSAKEEDSIQKRETCSKPEICHESEEPLSQSVRSVVIEALDEEKKDLSARAEVSLSISADEKRDQKPVEQLVSDGVNDQSLFSDPAESLPEVSDSDSEEEFETKTVFLEQRERTDSDADSETITMARNEDAVLIRLNTREVHFITSALTRIGRSYKRCDFEIKNNLSVSNHHADIVFYNDSYYLKDADSSNGTFIGEMRLNSEKRMKLPNMSVFRISDECILLLYGEAVLDLKNTKRIALLFNKKTQTVQLVGCADMYLDRAHKWPDGTFNSGKISREHAVIRQIDGAYALEDRGSKNGTYLNGTRIASGKPILLSDMAQIRLPESELEFVLISI